jgi:hypothetical protein
VDPIDGDLGVAMMRYELTALVARPTVLQTLEHRFAAVRLVALNCGLALVPVTPELRADAGRSVLISRESGFAKLTCGVAEALLEKGSERGPIAYLEAEYNGRDGHQAAAVWEHGIVCHGPEILGSTEPFPRSGGGPIGGALRQLGVKAVGRHDEFMVLGLGRFRLTEHWR